MVIEYIRYQIPPEQQKNFEHAYQQARQFLDASPNCLSYDLSRSHAEPQLYILRIEWDSLIGHIEGFRKSPEFAEFYELVKPFFGYVREMEHYTPFIFQSRV